MNRFESITLRYHHDLVNDEFANIGVVVYSPVDRFLQFRGTERFGRLSHFFSGFHSEDYVVMMRQIKSRFEKLSRQVAEEFDFESETPTITKLVTQVIHQDDGALRWGNERGGLTADPKADLERAFERVIGRFEEKHESERRDDIAVWKQSFQPVFHGEKIRHFFTEHEIAAPLATHKFPKAWKNGVWNVYQPLSFDLVRPETIEKKAHTWFGRSVHLLESSEKPRIHYLLGEPAGMGVRPAYEKAKEILISADGITLIEEEDVSTFGQTLEDQILATFSVAE